MIFRRFSHISFMSFYSTGKTSSASQLAVLRKKTGYSISNCKKALETNENDLEKAEAWLISQAQAQGWDKAAKLQNRATLNGLVGVISNQNRAVMVEVNCETDFVARNEKFQNLVAKITETCFRNLPLSAHSSSMLKVNFSSEQLGALETSEDGSRLTDLLALNIGQIGENMSLRRATALFCPQGENIKLAGCSHPANNVGEIGLGKYGAVVAYVENIDKPKSDEQSIDSSDSNELPESINIDKLPKQLCQHIIGMNPQSIERIEGFSGDEETALLHQEFVANPEYRVEEVLNQVGWQVKGFLRLECGESQA